MKRLIGEFYSHAFKVIHKFLLELEHGHTILRAHRGFWNFQIQMYKRRAFGLYGFTGPRCHDQYSRVATCANTFEVDQSGRIDEAAKSLFSFQLRGFLVPGQCSALQQQHDRTFCCLHLNESRFWNRQ